MAKPKRPTDINQRARFIVDLVTGEDEAIQMDKKKALSKKGVKGGKVGGAARAKKLTAKKRSSIAKKAAKARWNK